MSLNFAFVAMLLAAQATAEDVPQLRDPPACWSGSQREMNACAWTEYQRADALMNEQWEKTFALMKRLDSDAPAAIEIIGNSSHSEALLNGQRAWLRFRDAYCPIFGASGGSMAPMLTSVCLRDVTKARTEQLESLLLNPATGNPYYEDQ